MSEYIYGCEPCEKIPKMKMVQREEIVRCRDCEYLNMVGKCPCGFHALEDMDGYCKWGKRAEVDA